MGKDRKEDDVSVRRRRRLDAEVEQEEVQGSEVGELAGAGRQRSLLPPGTI